MYILDIYYICIYIRYIYTIYYNIYVQYIYIYIYFNFGFKELFNFVYKKGLIV
jgi:hypothetical protein